MYILYIIAIQIAILIAHSVLFQFRVVNTKVCSLHFMPVDFVSKGYRKRKQLIDNAVSSVFDWVVDVTPKRKPPSVMLGHVQVVLASVGHESGAHTAEHLEDCRHYKKHRSTSVSVVGCHFPGLWVSKS